MATHDTRTPIDKEMIDRIVNKKVNKEDLKIMGDFFAIGDTKEVRMHFVSSLGKYLNDEQIHDLNDVVMNNINDLVPNDDPTMMLRPAEGKIFQHLILLEATLTGTRYNEKENNLELSSPIIKHYETLKETFYKKREIPPQEWDEKIKKSANFLLTQGLLEKNVQIPTRISNQANTTNSIMKSLVKPMTDLIIKRTLDKCNEIKGVNQRDLSTALFESLSNLSPDVLLKEQYNIPIKVVDELNKKAMGSLVKNLFFSKDMTQIVTKALSSMSPLDRVIIKGGEKFPKSQLNPINISKPLEVIRSTVNIPRTQDLELTKIIETFKNNKQQSSKSRRQFPVTRKSKGVEKG